MWQLRVAMTNKILPIQATVLLALFISWVYAVKPRKNQNKTGACTNSEHSASCFLNLSVNLFWLGQQTAWLLPRLTDVLQSDCKERLERGVVVKAIHHLYWDKEKVKLPAEMLGQRKTVLQKKRKILFQSWENMEEEITGENLKLYCTFIKVLVSYNNCFWASWFLYIVSFKILNCSVRTSQALTYTSEMYEHKIWSSELWH